MPLAVNVTIIVPDDRTTYLVGPEGTVWTQPAVGDPYIIAARSATERVAAQRFVAELLGMGLVPYGIPLGQRVAIALFGGNSLRDCQWVPWSSAPAPAGGDPLPTQAVVLLPPSEYTCTRCGHTWQPQQAKQPRICPKCKSPYWDRPKGTTGTTKTEAEAH